MTGLIAEPGTAGRVPAPAAADAPAVVLPRPRSGSARVGFRRHLRAEVVAGDAAYVFSERGVTALTGSLVEAVAPLLDGSRDLAAILAELPAGTTRPQLEDLVRQLTAAGLVTSRPATEPPAADEAALAYWDGAGLDGPGTAGRLATGRIALVAVGDQGDEATRAALRDTAAALAAGGVRLTAGDEPADLSVVLCDDYLASGLAEIDAAHRAAGRPWLLAKPGGATVWIGPVFQPGRGCWHCLATRLRDHRPAEAWVQSALGRTGPAPRAAVSLPPLAGAAAQLVALEATKWLAGLRRPSQLAVWTFDSLDLAGRHHQVRPRPQCGACGDPGLVAAAADRPVVLVPRPKVDSGDGGHRALPPEQVLEQFRHLVSPVTGVVKEIVRDRRGPAFFTSFRSGANQAAGACRVAGLRSALRVENGGKGTTPLQAEVGALCEALERHSGIYAGDERRVRGSLRSLGERALHPNSSLLYDDRQYAGRVEWNRRHSPFQFVCAPFDETAELDWTPVWSLTEQRSRLLPTGMLYFNAPAAPGPRTVRADSNGNAAGGRLEDAVLQGLLEVVERDAVALWWYNRTRAPGVDLDAFADPWVDELRTVYAGMDREVWVLDVTADLGVPTMVAVSRSVGGGREHVLFGFGAHPDPRVALKRSLAELNQLVPGLLRAGPDAAERCGDDPDAAAWLRSASVDGEPWLVADPAVRARRPGDFGYRPCADLTADVRAIQRRIERQGMQLLVLDQTRPDIGLPVVKVIVPGMRHFWARYAPGRLFDVPVRLGRLARPTPYDELNPFPLFL